MKRYMMMAAICGCLLIGSLYPRLILDHHVKLVDELGNEVVAEGEYLEKVPVKLEFRFLKFFRIPNPEDENMKHLIGKILKKHQSVCLIPAWED